ncbi:hypothetical protein DFR76_115119 [Nocardia pseudobrasiliensis]|uniref:Uncharacterized protein n=1 Tax=Nocardia pseudobrasiliensis TaxID=45979 RepID=A0A370HPL9_9NOCA|nr:hypothetical protein DFR76_115119 [Nocardia pseudobrasiliensis]
MIRRLPLGVRRRTTRPGRHRWCCSRGNRRHRCLGRRRYRRWQVVRRGWPGDRVLGRQRILARSGDHPWFRIVVVEVGLPDGCTESNSYRPTSEFVPARSAPDTSPGAGFGGAVRSALFERPVGSAEPTFGISASCSPFDRLLTGGESTHRRRRWCPFHRIVGGTVTHLSVRKPERRCVFPSGMEWSCRARQELGCGIRHALPHLLLEQHYSGTAAPDAGEGPLSEDQRPCRAALGEPLRLSARGVGGLLHPRRRRAARRRFGPEQSDEATGALRQ